MPNQSEKNNQRAWETARFYGTSFGDTERITVVEFPEIHNFLNIIFTIVYYIKR